MRLALLVLLAPAVASADPAPSFEILDRGTAVEVIAHNVTAAKTAISPIRSRLEIPLAGHPRADRALPTDATVKLVEFDGTEPRVLSVKLGFERPEVKALAKYAQAIQVGTDVHVMVPRSIPAEGAAVVLPEPTLSPELAAKVAAITAPDPVKPEPKPEPKLEAPPPAPPPKVEEPKPAAAVTKPAPATAAPAKDEAWQKLSMYGAAGLAAIGCGIWLLRRRKAAQGPTTSIDVIAQKSLGAKAKVVWFTAGGREMVVAVTPQQVRMLGQWKRSTDGGAQQPLPAAHALAADKPASSPAVAGILKLRERPSMANIPRIEEEPGDDMDTAWAREIMAATGARR